jgi:hypothetical protein
MGRVEDKTALIPQGRLSDGLDSAKNLRRAIGRGGCLYGGRNNRAHRKKGGLSARRLVIFPMHRLGGTSLPEKCSLSSV